MRRDLHAFKSLMAIHLKKLARNLYSAFRGDRRRRHLIPSDFYPAYRTQAEAKEAFKIFDRDGNEDITRAEIKTTIMMIYKERRFLARSLRDVDHALSSLDMILMMFFAIVLFFSKLICKILRASFDLCNHVKLHSPFSMSILGKCGGALLNCL